MNSRLVLIAALVLAFGAAEAAPKRKPTAAEEAQAAAVAAEAEAGKFCAVEADAKGLHGPERKDFRKGCMPGAIAAAKEAAAKAAAVKAAEGAMPAAPEKK